MKNSSKSGFSNCGLGLGLAAVLLVSSMAQPAMAAKEKKMFGWGKAGVSYEEYRADALECATAGLNTKIDDTAPVEKLREGSRKLEEVDSRISLQQGSLQNNIAERQAIESSTHPKKQISQIKEIMFETVRQCK